MIADNDSFAPTSSTRIVVVGHGMVGQKLIESLVAQGAQEHATITCIGEEIRPAYDRVGLTKWFKTRDAADLNLTPEGFFDRPGLELVTGDKVAVIDRVARVVRTASGRAVPYDKLVLATGSAPFVPPVPGGDAAQVHVYRTIEDLEAITAGGATARTGVVLGGGLLGLEAAYALHQLGLEVHVLQMMDRLMDVQLDSAGGALLRKKIEELGVTVHVNANTERFESDASGRVTRVVLKDGKTIDAQVVVLSCGIRPRDELARACGIEVGPRGGIVIDRDCVTSDPDILAIGECALAQGRIYGLVAPGYRMAEVAAAVLLDEKSAGFEGADMSTKLKLLGVDVASFGDALGRTPECREVSWNDRRNGVYKRINLSADGKTLLGGILVGDTSDYDILLQMALGAIPTPESPESLVAPAASAGPASAAFGVDALPGASTLCSCNNVSKSALCAAVAAGATTMPLLKKATGACTGCGGCSALVSKVLSRELEKAGVAVSRNLCEHFDHTRQDLYQLVRVHGHKTFDEVVAAHGRGLGCEVCKPLVGSLLASVWNEHVMEKKHHHLQDTNDRFMANMQKDGTYSVVPRVPGGEITPAQLIAIGTVAAKYNLYTKITGGQRIDLFGARLEQLPAIWEALIAAGMETGHAYGKSLRTVKSCVGSTWCRYGVQDSTTLAIELENRYKGLRAPHKIKMAVSGCTRECAEAQSKDVGVIATEKGWNLYVCGNGGMKPRHADLLASDLDRETLLRLVDRFLMFYVRTADRLQRTSTWLDDMEGGLERLRQVVVEDSLGIGETLDREMDLIRETYRCEWKVAVEDPAKRALFQTYVNDPSADPMVEMVGERGQIRPARRDERLALLK